MADPTDTIRRGLDAHERARTGPKAPRLAHLAGVTGDISSLSAICDSVRKVRARLIAMREVEAKDATASAAVAKDAWKDKGVTIDENDIRTDGLGATQRRKFVQADMQAARKERMATTAEERGKLAETLRAAKANLDLTRDLWSSSVAVLMRQTVGSAQRATYTANLAAAGPREVDLAMDQAARTGDKELAAAACVRIDAMGAESRKLLKFSKTDGADQLVFVKFAKAKEALGMADYFRESGDLMARELEGRPISADAKIRVGLKLAELEADLGRTIDVDNETGDGIGQKPGEDFNSYLDRKFPGGALPAGWSFVDTGDNSND